LKDKKTKTGKLFPVAPTRGKNRNQIPSGRRDQGPEPSGDALPAAGKVVFTAARGASIICLSPMCSLKSLNLFLKNSQKSASAVNDEFDMHLYPH